MGAPWLEPVAGCGQTRPAGPPSGDDRQYSRGSRTFDKDSDDEVFKPSNPAQACGTGYAPLPGLNAVSSCRQCCWPRPRVIIVLTVEGPPLRRDFAVLGFAIFPDFVFLSGLDIKPRFRGFDPRRRSYVCRRPPAACRHLLLGAPSAPEARRETPAARLQPLRHGEVRGPGRRPTPRDTRTPVSQRNGPIDNWRPGIPWVGFQAAEERCWGPGTWRRPTNQGFMGTKKKLQEEDHPPLGLDWGGGSDTPLLAFP